MVVAVTTATTPAPAMGETIALLVPVAFSGGMRRAALKTRLRRTVARIARLAAVEATTATTAMPAAVMTMFTVTILATAVFVVASGFRLGGRAAEKALQPAEETAGLLRRGNGRSRGLRIAWITGLLPS